MANLTLYTHPHSRGVTISWMLEECQAQYTVIPLEWHTSMKSPEYLALNPAGKVPTLKHGDIVITESAAIVAYLADIYPEKQLAPAIGDPKRGEYYRWLFIICNQFEPALTDKLFNFTITAEMRFALGHPEVDVIVEQITQQLTKNTYLLGDQFSAADLLMIALLNWAANAKKIISLNSVLQAYLEKCTQRPACVKALQLNQQLFERLNK